MSEEFKVGQEVRFFDDGAIGTIVEVHPDWLGIKCPEWGEEIFEVDITPLQSLTFELLESL
jgi:hypothetical protein